MNTIRLFVSGKNYPVLLLNERKEMLESMVLRRKKYPNLEVSE